MYYCLSGFDLQSTLSDEWERLSDFPLCRSPSDSTAPTERLLYNFLQPYLSLHPQEGLYQQGHSPCSGVNCLQHLDGAAGQGWGWMEILEVGGADKLGIQEPGMRFIQRKESLGRTQLSPPFDCKGALVYALQSDGK